MTTASAILLITSGCAKNRPHDGAHLSASAEGSAASTGPSFRRDILPVLKRHCSEAKGCHGDEPTDSVELDLRPLRAFEELVDVPAKGRPTSWRVRSGHPSESFLLDKLTGKLKHGEGKAMPLDKDTGVAIEPSPLPRGFVDGVLRPWIVAGAPN